MKIPSDNENVSVISTLLQSHFAANVHIYLFRTTNMTTRTMVTIARIPTNAPPTAEPVK